MKLQPLPRSIQQVLWFYRVQGYLWDVSKTVVEYLSEGELHLTSTLPRTSQHLWNSVLVDLHPRPDRLKFGIGQFTYSLRLFETWDWSITIPPLGRNLTDISNIFKFTHGLYFVNLCHHWHLKSTPWWFPKLISMAVFIRTIMFVKCKFGFLLNGGVFDGVKIWKA